MQKKSTVTKSIYRIQFIAQGNFYELYAKHIKQGELFGFIEVEQIVFGETSSVVVDPAEERLKNEFNGVKCTYIPLHAVVRIDMVEKEGPGKVTVLSADNSNIKNFPTSIYPPREKK